MYDSLEIARKAEEITKKIGYKLIREGYYSDTCYGLEYKLDELVITNTSCIRINIGNIEVLNYNLNTYDCNTFIRGKWIELIDAIYEDIPNVLYKRQKNRDEEKNKNTELNELIPYLKDLIRLYKKSISIKDAIDSKLELYDIKIEKIRRVCSLGSYNDQSGELNTYESNFIDIKYEGERVLECRDNAWEPILTFSSLAKKFKPGIWITLFKSVIDEVKDNYENIISQELDDMTDNMLRRYR